MCAYSAIVDNWRENVPDRYPNTFPPQAPLSWPVIAEVSRAEFDALKREVEELKTLLEAAKKFDAATGQPNCEMEEKVELLRRVADHLGIVLNI